MEFIKNLFQKISAAIKKFFRDKTLAFYIASVIAAVSVITAIIYAAVFGGTRHEYMSWLGFTLMLLAAAAFITLSMFGFTRQGAAAMAVLDFFALLVALKGTYTYFVPFAIGGGVSAVMGDFAAMMFIVCVMLLVVCCIVANVTAWLRLQKEQTVLTVN